MGSLTSSGGPPSNDNLTCSNCSSQATTLQAAKRSRWRGTELLRLNVGGTQFLTTRQTLGSLGPSFFDGLWEAGVEEEELFLDHSPEAFRSVYEALLVAREDLPAALHLIHTALCKQGAVLRLLLRRLMLEWVVGASTPMPPGPAADALRASLDPDIGASVPNEFAGVFASSINEDIALPSCFDAYDADLLMGWPCRGARWNTEHLRPRPQKEQVLFAFESRLCGSLAPIVGRALRPGAQLNRRLARICTCPLLTAAGGVPNRIVESDRVCTFDSRVHSFGESDDEPETLIETNTAALAAALGSSDSSGSQQLICLCHGQVKVAERLIFDFGAERLLLLEGAVFVVHFHFGQTWEQEVTVRIEAFCEFSEPPVSYIEVPVRLPSECPERSSRTPRSAGGGDPASVLQVGPLEESRHLCGRMFAVTVTRRSGPSSQRFLWTPLAVELYGTVLEVPRALRVPKPRGSFLFDECSERDFFRL